MTHRKPRPKQKTQLKTPIYRLSLLGAKRAQPVMQPTYYYLMRKYSNKEVGRGVGLGSWKRVQNSGDLFQSSRVPDKQELGVPRKGWGNGDGLVQKHEDRARRCSSRTFRRIFRWPFLWASLACRSSVSLLVNWRLKSSYWKLKVVGKVNRRPSWLRWQKSKLGTCSAEERRWESLRFTARTSEWSLSENYFVSLIEEVII